MNASPSNPLNTIKAYVPIDSTLATSGQPTEAEFRDIAAAGFRIVLNLALPTSPGALPDERATVTALGMDYTHLPVPFEAPQREHYQRFEHTMREREGSAVWIHCAMNYRVSAFLAVYRVRRLGWTRDDALAELRKVWLPDAVWTEWIEACLSGSSEASAPSAPSPAA